MNRFIESIGCSASMELMKRAKELHDKGVDVIGLGGGEPNFDTPQFIKDKVIKEILDGNTHYAVGKGLFQLRKKISDKLKRDNHIDISPENIVVTPGAKMAIYLSVRACISDGDEVLIPTPSWVSYKEIVKAAGGVPIEVPLNGEKKYEISEEILLKYINSKTKMIIICSPNNPTGRIINEKEIESLIAVLENTDIVLLSDEVYEKINYVDNVTSPASYYQLKEKTITINGFSKAYAMTGWRLGYLAAPKRYTDVIEKLYTHTVTGTSPFIQEAAIVALDCEDSVQKMRNEYQCRRDFFIKSLNRIEGVTTYFPEGAFYAWCKFDLEGDISEQLLNGANVIGVPGLAYGKDYDSFIRFSFASNMEDLEKAIDRIEKYMESRKRLNLIKEHIND